MSINLFQVIAVCVLACLVVLTIVAVVRGSVRRREAVVLLTLWLAAGFAVLSPDSTTAIARKLGIERGANLLLYSSVVVMMIGFSMVYVRLRKLRREITLLVRRLAIRDAHMDEAPPRDTT